jgi:hypothetical protein
MARQQILFFRESEIVTVSIGPGTKAPESPTAKEVAANRNISIKIIITKSTKMDRILNNNQK